MYCFQAAICRCCGGAAPCEEFPCGERLPPGGSFGRHVPQGAPSLWLREGHRPRLSLFYFVSRILDLEGRTGMLELLHPCYSDWILYPDLWNFPSLTLWATPCPSYTFLFHIHSSLQVSTPRNGKILSLKLERNVCARTAGDVTSVLL